MMMATSKRIDTPAMASVGFWPALGRGPVMMIEFDYKDTRAKARPLIVICLCNQRVIPG